MFSPEIIQLVSRFKDKSPSSNFKRWEPELYQKLVEETSFLPINSRMVQRLWHVKNNSKIIPLCKICKTNVVKWNADKHQYSTYCSSKCVAQDSIVIEKQKQTILNRYGVEYYTQAPDFNDKRINTSLLKYGTEWATQTTEVQQKIRNTTKERYGKEFYTQTDDYKIKYNNTCTLEYGVDFFSQRNISLDTLNKLSTKDWLYTEHYVNQRTITNIAEELLVDTTTVVSYLTKHSLQVQRFENSLPERQITEWLNTLNVKYITNIRTIIPPKELDIYLPDYNIAIEYCGLYWHSTAQSRIDAKYHQNKLILCSKQNIRLITIFEDEWLYSSDLVKHKIAYLLSKSELIKIFARKCTIISPITIHKQKFFNTYHIQGNGPGSINIGLEYNNELVACMSFIKQSDGIFVLNRYATSCNIIGGFSKLLSHFKKNNKWTQIISFADLRWSQGDLYETNGFTLDKILPPDYEYVDLKNMKRIHKFNFRHKNLPKILGENYDASLTEIENCTRNNWHRIYNCGLLRYILIP